MQKTLERSLGFWSVFSISLGGMIGPGLFVLPAIAAGKTGPAVSLAYLLAGVLVLPTALSKAELATGIPTSGGTYVYLDRSMGSFIGTIGGLGTWFSLILKSAFSLVGLGAYLVLFVSLPTKHVALFLCLTLIAINIVGVKKTAKLQMAIIVCVFSTLALFIVRGMGQLNPQFYSPFVTHGWQKFLSATGLVFVSYAGIIKVASIVEEVKQPERNVPLGMLASLGLMAVVYTLVALVLTGMIPLGSFENDLTPVATAAQMMFGQVGLVIWAVVAALALTSMANAGVLSSSRFPFAMGRDGLLPKRLMSIYPRFRTPLISILLTGAIMFSLIAFVDVESLAKLASAFMMLIFGMVNLSVIIFRESHAGWYKPNFRSPGYPWVQLVGILATLVLIPTMGSVLPLIGVAGIFVGGSLWYLLYARKQVDREGLLAQTHTQARQLQTLRAGQSPTPGRRETLVPFYGTEQEAEIEARIRLAHFLSIPDGRVHPVHFEEVPDETLLEALRDVDQGGTKFEDRFHHATRQWGDALTLETFVTHEAKVALFRHADAIDARWILMGWQRKSVWNVLIRAHKYWWLNHTPCNVAQYLHRESSEVRKIAVMTQPGPYDALIAHVADQLGFVFDAEIVLLHVAEEAESEAKRMGHYHESLCQLFRGKVESRIVHDRKRLERAVAETEDFDLLIIGAPAEDQLVRIFARSFEDKLAEMASCAVFQVQSPRSRTHEVASVAADARQASGFHVSPFLHHGAVEARIEIDSKDALFARIAKQFAQATEVATVEAFEKAFWAREGMQNTAMDHGVAMPHAVIPELPQTYFGVFTLRQPIDYDVADRSEVDICIATVGPPDQRTVHLKILSRIAYLINEAQLLDRLRGADSGPQLAGAIAACETETAPVGSTE